MVSARKYPLSCPGRARKREEPGPRGSTTCCAFNVALRAFLRWVPDLVPLAQADIAFARVNDTAALAAHPQLRRIEVATPVGAVSYPAPAARRDGAPRRYGAVPALGEHSDAIRTEFMGRAPRR